MSISLEQRSVLLDILRREVVPTNGCTDPISVAYSVAVARKAASGEVTSLRVSVNPGLFKNAQGVGIPGSSARGLLIAAALGCVAGNPDREYQVIEGIRDSDVARATALVQSGIVDVGIDWGHDSLFIETELVTASGSVRVVTVDKYLNVVSVERTDGVQVSVGSSEGVEAGEPCPISTFELDELVEFANFLPLRDVSMIEDGIRMNMDIAGEGLHLDNGFGHQLAALVQKGDLGSGMATRAQVLCSAASQARMSGSPLPVMSSAGSGNHGITVFLTCVAAAEALGSSHEELVRSLILANLVTVYVKAFTGTLSAMCGCGVAAGVGATVGVVYLLKGTTMEMLGAMMNMVGSISGVVCDGAKEGCSLKVALASGWAVESALLAASGAIVPSCDGIVAPDMRSLLGNLGLVSGEGMKNSNRVVIGIMQRSEAGGQPGC